MERDSFSKDESAASDFDELLEEDSYHKHMEKMEESTTEATPEQIEKFNKFVDFLNRDMLVKKDLAELSPEDSESTEEYSNRLYGGFKDIKFNINKMMENFFPDEDIEKRLKEIYKDIVNSSGNKRNLASVYKNDFAEMSPDFVEEVNQKASGYLDFYPAYNLGYKAKTINEILHLIHSAVVNNDNVLKSLPILESDGENVKLYGTDETRNQVAEDIFERSKGDPNDIDIVSLKNRVLIMARDRGHALTIDAQKDVDGKYYVSYFLPKTYDIDKINSLPGVRKVHKKEETDKTYGPTTGMFRIDNEARVGQEISNFINEVPSGDSTLS